MAAVLLFTDTDRIEDEQDTLANVVELFQSIYTAIKAVGVTPTLAEINELVTSARRRSTSDYVNTYVVNKLIAAVSPYVVNGVTFTDAAVRGVIKVPDTSGITVALHPVLGGNSQNVFIGKATAAQLNLLAVAADVVSAVEGADDTLAATYTYYTKTDASAAVATSLQAVADALNTFDGSNNNFFARKTPPGDERWKSNARSTAIPGLELNDDRDFVISLNFIREYEKLGTLEFVRNAD